MQKNDLISREALKKEIDKLEQEEHSISPSWFLGLDDCRDIIDCIPAVDAAPVMHGRWLTHEWVRGVAYCSVCCYELKTNNTNYCPHCGAKMNGGDDDV